MARGSVNKVILIGTLGRDPEMRYLPNGNAVCSASLATDEGYKDRNTGQQVDKTEWHRVEAFGRLAEVMGEYLKKGSKVYVEGKLRTDEYEKDGIKRYSTKIIVNEMTMLDSRPQDGGQQYAPQQQGQVQGQQQGYGQAQNTTINNQRPQQAPAYAQPAGQSFPQQAPQQAPLQQAGPQPVNAFDDFDDDIPFSGLITRATHGVY